MRQERAERPAADPQPMIATIQAGGATSLRAIAAELSRRGIPTPHGIGKWQAMQVQRVLERAG